MVDGRKAIGREATRRTVQRVVVVVERNAEDAVVVALSIHSTVIGKRCNQIAARR